MLLLGVALADYALVILVDLHTRAMEICRRLSVAMVHGISDHDLYA